MKRGQHPGIPPVPKALHPINPAQLVCVGRIAQLAGCGVQHNSPYANLELEIDERLQVSSDELVEHEDRHHHDEADEPDGQQREVDPVPALPTLR